VDRNTIIALVLVLGIWLAWPKWMEWMYGTDETRPVPSDSTYVVQPAVDSLSAPDPARADRQTERRSEPRIDVFEDDAPIRRITIETEKYSAVLSTRGAVLRSVALTEFATPNGDPVNLLPSDGRGMGMLIGPRGEEIDLTERVFSVDTDLDHFTIATGDSLTLRFTCRLSDGRRAYKTITFFGGRYYMSFDAGMVGGGEYERIALTWKGELPSTEGDFTREMQEMKAQAFVGGSVENIQYSGKPKSESFVGLTDWVSVRNKYFLAAFAPISLERSEVELTASGVPNVAINYEWKIAPFDVTQRNVRGLLYLGPIDVDRLVVIGHNLERAADLGWTLIRPISKGILWTFLNLYKVIPIYGLVIIIFSLLVKLLLHPLTKKSYESMGKMKKLQPLMQELREKYKDDQQKLNTEMMKLYKEQGANPLGGCLPMLLQFPVFIAIYAVLGNNIEFRQAEFFWWISDLSSPDTVLIMPFSIPFYGDRLNILPLLWAASMFVQQKLMITDPKQKFMIYIMPVVLLVMFNRLASGLVLYWLMFNVLSGIHQYIMTKKQNEADAIANGEVIAPRRNKTTKARKR